MLLDDYELQVLRELGGELPASPWGAALGQALEVLMGYGLAERAAGQIQLTAKGRLQLDRERVKR